MASGKRRVCYGSSIVSHFNPVRVDAVEPGRIGQTEDVSTEDAYGNGPVVRSITVLRGKVRPGNSGGPMVDRAGQVVATVFAAITGSPTGGGGFAVPNALVRRELDKSRNQFHSVSTGA